MYYKLFNATTKAIEVLQEAQNETKDMYSSAGEANLKLIDRDDKENPPYND